MLPAHLSRCLSRRLLSSSAVPLALSITGRSSALVSASTVLIGGIDESGRGAVIGPMTVALCLVSAADTASLYAAGVRDSKTVAKGKRTALAAIIRERAHAVRCAVVTAEQIDTQRRHGRTVNDITVDALTAVVYSINDARFISPSDVTFTAALAHERCAVPPLTLFVDSMDVTPQRLTRRLQSEFPAMNIWSLHRADALHTQVAAASIIAKTTRDELMADIQRRSLMLTSLDVGSGYPADTKTQRFIKEWIRARDRGDAKWTNVPSDILRTSWHTQNLAHTKDMTSTGVTAPRSQQ